MDKECIKCKEQGSLILRKKDVYCENCFNVNVIHKFRSSLGKNKMLKPHEKVLLCLSGGSNSFIMLDIICNAINLDLHKKLRIDAICLHIIDTANVDVPLEEQITMAKVVIDRCKSYGINVFIVQLTDFEDESLNMKHPGCIPSINTDCVQKLNGILDGMTATGKIDYLLRLRRKIFIQCAEELRCNFIFTAETAVTLATNMLSTIVVGRGSQVEHDVGFCDSRNKIRILRPMKDVTYEELQHYAAIRNMDAVHNVRSSGNNSLQSAIKSFVVDLQENFQATISTVCKTADKIGGNSEGADVKFCVICESPFQIEDSKLSAHQAINISRTISSNPQYFNDEQTFSLNDSQLKTITLPFADKSFCYGCSRTCTEIKNL